MISIHMDLVTGKLGKGSAVRKIAELTGEKETENAETLGEQRAMGFWSSWYWMWCLSVSFELLPRDKFWIVEDHLAMNH